MTEWLSSSLFYGAVISILAYEIGLLVRRRFKLAFLHPLLLAVIIVIGVNALTGVKYEDYNNGAKYLSYLLTPVTVCLAVPLYEQLRLLKDNWKAVVSGLLAGVLVSLGSIWLLSYLFGLDHTMYVTLLPKSITTAIGMSVSEELGGIVTITVAVIVITGILGNVLADLIYKLFRVTHPIARGIGLGASAHAIGTARAIEYGPVEGAMSSLAIAASGLLTVVGASFFAQLL